MPYRVKALYMSGRGNNVFNGGDIVEQEQINAPVAELIAKGFLEEVPAEESDNQFKDLEEGLEQGLDENLNPNPNPPPPPPPAISDSEEDVHPDTEAEVKVQEEEKETEKEVDSEEESVNPLLEETKAVKIPEIGEVNYEFLINELKNLGVAHKANISKKEAYELWIGAQK